MELDTEQSASEVLEGRHRRRRRGRGDHETGRGRRHRVAVRHPHLLGGRQMREQDTGGDDGETGRAVFRGAGPRDRTGQRMRHHLVAIADAEHRNPGVEQHRVHLGGTGRVHRLRPTRKDHCGRIASKELLDREVPRHDLRIHVALAHPPGDELGVLRAEIHDQDRVMSGAGRGPAGLGDACRRARGTGPDRATGGPVGAGRTPGWLRGSGVHRASLRSAGDIPTGRATFCQPRNNYHAPP